MSLLRRPRSAAFLFVFAVASVGFGSSPAFLEPPNPRWAPLEKAYADAEETRDFALLKEELRKFFTSSDRDTQALGLRWIGHRKDSLTSSEIDDLETFYIRLNPEDTISRGLRVEMAVRHLEESALEHRRATYWKAVRDGSVTLEGVEPISRTSAIARAAFEGIEDFAPLIERYAEEIDRVNPESGYRQSARLLWYVKLRAGAKDRDDALRLHAQRLAEMEDDVFHDLMEKDLAFRSSTRWALELACSGTKALSPPCFDFARIAIRQSEFRKARLRDGSEPDAQLFGGTWLEGLESMTGAANVQLYRQKYSLPALPSPK